MDQSKNKIIIVGDPGVGKTAFINKHRTAYFEEKYTHTKGTHISNLSFLTSQGRVIFDIYDIAEVDIRQYTGARACIIMFDVTDPQTYKDVFTWQNIISKSCPNIPIVICGNKADLKDRKVHPKDIHLDVKYYDISTKVDYHIEKPFLYIIKKLYGENTCLFEDDSDLPDYQEKIVEKTAMQIIRDFKHRFPHRKIFTAICKYFMDHEDTGYISQGVKNTKLVVFAVDKTYKHLSTIIKRLELDRKTVVIVQESSEPQKN